MLENGLCYRDSRMAEEAEMRASLAPFQMDDAGAKTPGGPVLYREGNTAYSDPSDGHSYIIGGTGSMKTLRFVLPLIRNSAMAGESMVIVDPKGELVRKTGDFLKEQGYDTSVLNWRNPSLSPDRWNPMGRAAAAYQRGGRHIADAENYLNDLLHELFFNRSSADKDIFWNHSAGQLALGLCKLILANKEQLSIRKLLEWRHGQLRDGTVQAILKQLPASHEVYQNLSGYINLKAENTKSCIDSTFDHLVGLFAASSSLTEMMSESTFQLEDIGRRKTAVFLVVPDEKTTFHFLCTIFINQCYESLLDIAEEYDGTLPTRVNFILEEFGNIPKLSDLVAMLTAARSRNIRFHLVCQSYSQMLDKYGENVSRTILDNCGNLIYLHTHEMSFLEYISRLAGKNEYNRPLFSTSRLQHLARNETLIFHDRCYPFLARDIPLIFEYPLKLGSAMPPAAPHTAAVRAAGRPRS